MVRPYAVKWLKRKKKKRSDPEEEAGATHSPGREQQQQEQEQKQEEEDHVVATEGKKRKAAGSVEEGALAAAGDPSRILPGLPVLPAKEGPKPGVIFVLENASLRVGKVGKKEQILSADEHATFLKRQNLNPADFRPDILHQKLNKVMMYASSTCRIGSPTYQGWKIAGVICENR